MPSATVLVVFDFETTGLEPDEGHEVIEVGAIPIIDGTIREDCAFQTLIDPDRAIPPDASSVHGITDAMVKGKPRIEVVLPEFLRFIGPHEMVAQNAEFDLKFLHACCRRLELSAPKTTTHCTMLMSRQLHPGERRHRLDDICRRLGIEVTGTRHRSIDDVLLTARAFLALRERIDGRNAKG